MNAFELAVMNRDIRLEDFATPFTTVEQVAAYLCDPENDTLFFAAWRAMVLNWSEKRDYSTHDWREIGIALTDCREVPAQWEEMFATYASLAQHMFMACLEVMTS